MSKKIEANLVYPGASIIRTHTPKVPGHTGEFTREPATRFQIDNQALAMDESLNLSVRGLQHPLDEQNLEMFKF